ncbi:hypothetical protein B9C88_17175 [Brevibacillus laterosporus]|uniref:hypothetical protein n=1 Tax=Brevibacillus laterosporus TaxID=1465 RepID=UPI000BD37A2D|nr:hypothetical protein [Brevibacillus laterosporus]PCN43182.1 hypothetical protein B9C88_17175 [Brevibacillus laterosporus]
MSYNFKALVIDDLPQQASTFETYKKYLKRKENIDIEFKVIHNESQYDENEPYDILLVDYNLRHGFFNCEKQLGNEFIESFRKKNKICKVIFYSSEFYYSPNNKKYKIPLADKDLFDLINDLQVDKIASKDNFNMMIQVIKECCMQLDILPLLLSRTLSEYKKKDITVSYTNLQGEEIDLSTLLDDIVHDNEQGKQFRKQIMDTILTVLFNYKY